MAIYETHEDGKQAANAKSPPSRGQRRSHGGLGRVAFMISWVLVIGACAMFMAVTRGSPVSGPSCAFLILGAMVFLIAERLKNLGFSRLWCLGAFVPLLNIMVWAWCMFCPGGYAQTRKLDTPGKIMAGLVGGMLLILVALSALAATWS